MPTTYDVEDVDELFVLVGAVGYTTNELLPANNPSIHSHLLLSNAHAPADSGLFHAGRICDD